MGKILRATDQTPVAGYSSVQVGSHSSIRPGIPRQAGPT
jgi:hypothetical protein